MSARCQQCDTVVTGSKTYCSGKCRMAASRARQRVVELAPEAEDRSTLEAVTRELEAVDRADTSLGRAAMALARRIDASTAVMGFAALVKQLEGTMKAAMAGVEKAESPVTQMRDELAARRLGA
jgi:hypothetical protein